MDHDQLVKEAEKLAEKLSPKEKGELSFQWSYVANHELRDLGLKVEHLADKLKDLRGLMIGIGIPILIALLLGLIKQFVG